MNIKKKKNLLPYFVYIILSAIGGFLTFYAMKWGPWAFSDSSAYVSAARNFSAGNGLSIMLSTGDTRAITEFPPFYSILLSFFGGNNLDYVNTIRWINIALFSSSIIIFSQVLFAATQNHLLSIAATILFVSFQKVISTFTSAMTEPLFLFLLMSSSLFFQFYLQKKNRFFFILFILASSLLPLTRYAGILFVSMFGISLFILLEDFSILKRIKFILFYYLSSLFPIGIWGYSLLSRIGTYGGKQFSFEISLIRQIVNGVFEEFKIIKYWIPYVEIFQNTLFESVIISTSIIFFVLILYLSIQKLFDKNIFDLNDQKVVFVFLNLMIVGYILFIALTHSITIPQIDIIDRMMIPIYPLFILVFFLCIDILLPNKKQNVYVTILLFSVYFICLRYNILFSNKYIKNMEAEGYGFTARVYQQSGIIEAIKKLPSNQVMISNSSGFVLFYTNKYPIQNDYFPNHIFGSGDSYGEKLFREENAALIILFSDFSNYYNDPSASYLNLITNTLKVNYIDSEGGIFVYPN